MNKRYLDFLAKMGIDHAHPGGRELTERLIQLTGISQQSKVLEVGCGTGATAAYLACKKQAQVTAVDLHPKMIEQAKRRAEKMDSSFTVRLASAEALPFDDATFDIILSESVTAFTDIRRSLSEYFRVLAPAGRFIAVEMTVEHELSAQDTQVIQDVYGVPELHTEGDWLKGMTEAGFRDARIYKAGDVPLAKADESETFSHLNVAPDPDDIGVWLDHLATMQRYGDVLTYRILLAKKV
ncbi:MAG: methyltransferase domain-containing protein [Sporolactobacillus sp.]